MHRIGGIYTYSLKSDIIVFINGVISCKWIEFLRFRHISGSYYNDACTKLYAGSRIKSFLHLCCSVLQKYWYNDTEHHAVVVQ